MSAVDQAEAGEKRLLDNQESGQAQPCSPSKRPRTLENGSVAAPKAIVTAMECEETLPPSIRKLLLALVTGCCAVPKDRRDPFQGQVAGLLREALVAAEMELQQNVARLNDDVDEREAELVSKDAAEATAQAEHAATRTAVIEKKVRVAKDTVALRKVTEKVNEALAAQETGDVKLNDAKQQQVRLQEAEEKILKPLKEGEFVGAKAKKQAQSLASLGKRNDFDESLTSGLVEVLCKKLETRTSFDTMVIGAFETQLHTRIAELDKIVAEEEPGQEARAQAVTSAKNDQDAAKHSQDASQDELKSALNKVKEAQKVVSNAKKNASKLKNDIRTLETQRSRASAVLRNIREGPTATLDALIAATDDEAVALAFKQFEERSAETESLTAAEEAAAEEANQDDAEAEEGVEAVKGHQETAGEANKDDAEAEDGVDAVKGDQEQAGEEDGDKANGTDE